MRKSNFWMISLIALFIIGFATGWNNYICIAVILNSVIVLADVTRTIYKRYSK